MPSASKMERTRYLLVHYQFDRLLTDEEVRKVFTSQLNRLYGIKGSLEMGLFLSWVHPNKPLAILRSSHTNVTKLYCLTFFITDLNSKPLTFIPIKTAGSIKKIKTLALSPNWKDLRDQE